MCVLSLFALPLSAAAREQAPSAADFDNATIDDPALGKIGWHLDRVNADAAGPLIVWLPGSGAFPFFQSFSDGSRGFGVPPALLAYRDRAHFLLVDKPGVPFDAMIGFDEERGRPLELDNPSYRAGMTRDNLVARAAMAVAAARERLGARVTQLVVIGGSEGAQYTFALARLAKADRAVAWGGLALPQYFDFVIEERLRAERGEITRQEAQANVEAIHQAMGAIAKDPLDLDKRFMGESYRRWSGFGGYSAVADMLLLDVPLLLVQGGNDRQAPILNTDFAQIAFLAAGKANLDYWVYPDADHGMRVPDPEARGGKRSIAAEIWARVWQWIEADPSVPAP